MNNFTFFRRFRLEDNNFDRYSDPDSLSFNSLSRSSSLIQFESLERQIQTSDANSFGGSTPSIHNQLNDSSSKCDAFTVGDGCGAAGATKSHSHDANDSTSVRCYYDLDKIDFNASLFLNCREQSSSESSSSTDNSIYYSDARESDADLKEEPTPSGDTMLLRGSVANSSNGSSSSCGDGRRIINPRCKNSVENLSEDSGYGDFPSIKNRSKSIPNLINADQSLIEEDEESTHNDSAHKSFDNIHCHYSRTGSNLAGLAARTHSNEIHSGISQREADALAVSPKIDAISMRSASFGAAKNSFTEHSGSSASSSSSSGAPSHTTIYRKTSTSSDSSQANSMSASLPDLCNHFSIFGDADAGIRTNSFCNANCGHSTTSNKSKRTSAATRRTSSPFEKDLFIVSSVPSDLNYFAKYTTDGATAVDRQRNDGERDETDCWNFTHRNASINSGAGVWPHQVAQASVATKNYYDLGHSFGSTEATPAAPFYLPPQQSFRQQKIINSSYSNLTILDYSSRGSSCSSFNSQLRMMADKSKRNSNASSRSGSGEFSRCNFLLDEISAHFDRNLSILNDKNDTDDSALLTKGWFLETKETNAQVAKPPQPPPRKLKSPTEEVKRPARSAEKLAKLSLAPSSPSADEFDVSPNTSFSFDRDPTNLKTCYADSLEHCNFDIDDSSTNNTETVERNSAIEHTAFTPPKHSTPVKREMVVSTPNLFLHKSDPVEEEFRQVASTHNSFNPLPQPDGMAEKTKGILAGGSRNSLGKGVSFYPFVSEISWREQSSNEDAADDEEEDGSDGDNDR